MAVLPEIKPEPMQCDRTMTRVERQEHRRLNGLCFYCGDSTHAISDCPRRTKRFARSATIGTVQSKFLLSVTLICSLSSYSVMAFVDSGAALNLMDLEYAKRCGFFLEPLQCPIPLRGIDATPLAKNKPQYWTLLTMCMAPAHQEVIRFLVLHNLHDVVVLGLPWLQAHNPVLDWKSMSVSSWGCQGVHGDVPFLSISSSTPSEVPEFLSDYRDVFDEPKSNALPPHRDCDCAINLIPGSKFPKGRLFNLSVPEHAAMRSYVKESLEKGHIRPSSSPLGAGFFFVAKKDGSLRPCIDYRLLNKITVKFQYPLPLLSDLFARIRGASWFTKIDLRGAYNLVRIRRGDEWKTAFNTPEGHFEYLVMPFGLANAPSVFQSFMHDIFREYLDKFLIVYLDDILIFSDDWESHVKQVEVDASEIGAGAVLSQRGSDCSVMKPCAFFSRKFSPAERNYDVGNREMLAMKWAFEEWRHWLEGAKHRVVVLTDHKNLTYLESAKRLNPRQARWSLFFARFDFVISYLPGSKNVKADALSRSFVPDSPGLSEPAGILKEGVIVSAISPDLRRVLQTFQANKPDRCPAEKLFVPDRWTNKVISETNGQTERTNQTLETYLRCFVSADQDDWVSFLPLAEFALNNRASSATLVLPFFCNSGFHPRFSSGQVESSDCPGVDTVVDRFQQIWTHVVDNLTLSQEKAQCFANRRRRVGPRLRVGDLVWLSSRHIPMKVSSPKFKPRFIGSPFIVSPPENITVNISQDALFTCQAEAYPGNLTYTWLWQDDNVFFKNDLKMRVRILIDGTLIIFRVKPEDAGKYTCVPSNSLGRSPSAAAFLSVQYPARVVNMPPIIYVPVGIHGHIRCPVDAVPPVTHVKWNKDGRPLRTDKFSGWKLLEDGSIHIEEATEELLGTYTCVPYNALGTMGQSPPARLLLK
ncbi:unnamed protein product, partial [Ranitomeya imitator]